MKGRKDDSPAKPGVFSVRNLRKVQPAQAIRYDEGDDIDEMPFMSVGNRNRTYANDSLSTTQVSQKEEQCDWLLDPMNLYMKGMAQRKAQMRQL